MTLPTHSNVRKYDESKDVFKDVTDEKWVEMNTYCDGAKVNTGSEEFKKCKEKLLKEAGEFRKGEK